MPYCPRCGYEVDDEKAFCPRCGTEIGQAPQVVEPVREGVVEHIKYAFSLARGNPLVFVPSLLGAVITFISDFIISSTPAFQEFQDYWMEWFEFQSGIVPAAYEYPDVIDMVPSWWFPVSLALGIVAWVIAMASYKTLWDAFDGEVDVVASFRFVFSRIFKYILAGIFLSVIMVGVALGGAIVVMGTSAISPAATGLSMFILILLMLAGAFLVSPLMLILVGEDFGFSAALRETVRFTKSNAFSYLGIGVVIFILTLFVFWIPYLGSFLAAVITVVGNMAVIDLYKQHQKRAGQ